MKRRQSFEKHFGQVNASLIQRVDGYSKLCANTSRPGCNLLALMPMEIGVPARQDGLRCTKVATNGKPYERFAASSTGLSYIKCESINYPHSDGCFEFVMSGTPTGNVQLAMVGPRRSS